MANEEIIMKLNMLEQAAEERKQQIEEIDRQVLDIISLRQSLDKLGKEKEILTSLGRGIFLNTKVNDDKVFVNVGSKVLVRKNFSEAGEIIEKQVAELERVKKELVESIGEINTRLYSLLEEAQSAEKS